MSDICLGTQRHDNVPHLRGYRSSRLALSAKDGHAEGKGSEGGLRTVEHDLKDEAIPRLETPRYYRWWKVEDLYKGIAAPQKAFPYKAYPTTGRPFSST
jgi:hypothetical protein